MSGAAPPRENRDLGDRFLEWTHHPDAVNRERVTAQTVQRTSELARLRPDILSRRREWQSARHPEHNAANGISAGAGDRVNMPSRRRTRSPPPPQGWASESPIPTSPRLRNGGRSAGATNETIRELRAQLQSEARLRERLERDLAEKDQRITDLEDQLREVQEHRIRAIAL